VKIKTYGYPGYTGQISRIDEGLKSLGHDLVDNPKESDLIYINDRTFEDLEVLNKCGARKIFNVLDVPVRHLNQKEIDKWKTFLSKADVVTAISETVSKDVKDILGFDSKVIYNPAKEISYNPELRCSIKQKFLYVGRANDPNKRFGLIREFFINYCKINPIELLAVCGSENPLFGAYYGVVSDEDLNKIYNSVEVVLLPSRQEGIGLSMIEALMARKFPICCDDSDAAKEFLPEAFLCKPEAESIMLKVKDYLENKATYAQEIERLGKKYSIQFNKISIARNIQSL
jgi:glycosyltransferase involved in cell wall biosynthesis